MIRDELLKKLSLKLASKPTDYMNSLRSNLQIYIESKEISLACIAEAADLSTETLKTLLYGKCMDCKLSTVVALAKALHVSIDELVGAGTLPEVTCESIKITRNLPDNSQQFVRWLIRYYEKMYSAKKVSTKSVMIMYPNCDNDGNLILSNNFELLDISGMPEEDRYKIFMGVRIPSDTFMPSIQEGEVLFLANDRNPLQNERVIVVNDGYIRIVKRKEEIVDGSKKANYYSIRNGKLLGTEDSFDDVVGYVVRESGKGLI